MARGWRARGERWRRLVYPLPPRRWGNRYRPGAWAGRAPPAAGGGREWDGRAGANFRAEPRGKWPARETCHATVPTSIEMSAGGVPGSEDAAVGRAVHRLSTAGKSCATTDAPAAGRATGLGTQGQCPGRLDSRFALPRTRLSPAPLRASVSPGPSRRRSPPAGCGGGRRGWPGSGILAWERQALLFPHDCLLLAPRKIRSSCSQ